MKNRAVYWTNVRTSAPLKLTVAYILDNLKHIYCHPESWGDFLFVKE